MSRDCVVTGRVWNWGRQTDSKALECGSLLKVMGRSSWCMKWSLLEVLERLNLLAQMFRSKAFLSVYLPL